MWLQIFRKPTVSFLLLYTSIFAWVDCAKILGAFTFNCKSHFMVFEALMKGLAARGHQVHVLSHFPQKEQVPNYIDIDVSGTASNIIDNVTIDTALSWRSTNLFGSIYFWPSTREMFHSSMSHPNAQALLRSNESYDVVITEIFGCECTLGFAWKFKAPFVNVIASVALPWAHDRIGNTDHPAYIPNIFLPYTHRMDFWQRLTNILYNLALNIRNQICNVNPTSVLLQEYFGKDVSSVEQLAKNASLVLVNSHFSITWPRPTVPAFVEVGGIHIQKLRILPQTLEKFIRESKHGIVYFNMGTMIRVQSFPPDKMKALLDAFAALQENVLMKYTDDYLPGKPDNVMISKWVPQLDVLNHPKTKLFISHGGLGGTHETVYTGVPVVGIPIFGDQQSNINNLKELGMAVIIRYEDISKDILLKAIRTVIDDQGYSTNAKRVSALFKNRPMTPLDTAVYWVEYVIRHRGAPQLRSAAADMPLYQYLLLDVIGFLLLTIVVFIFLTRLLVNTVIRAVMLRKIKHK